MNGQKEQLTVQQVYEVAKQRIIRCRAADPTKPGCGRPKGFPCFIEDFVPGHTFDDALRSSPFCSGCMCQADCDLPNRCTGYALSKALYEAGVPAEAGTLLGQMEFAHDDEGNDWENMMVDTLTYYTEAHSMTAAWRSKYAAETECEQGGAVCEGGGDHADPAPLQPPEDGGSVPS